jgi:hypothetical protein
VAIAIVVSVRRGALVVRFDLSAAKARKNNAIGR